MFLECAKKNVKNNKKSSIYYDLYAFSAVKHNSWRYIVILELLA